MKMTYNKPINTLPVVAGTQTRRAASLLCPTCLRPLLGCYALRRKMKILLLFTLALFASNSFADEQLNKEIEKLSALISDQYSSLVMQSISYGAVQEGNYIYSIFSIEGYYQGNNYQQFLAVYKKDYKTLDQPPFNKVGDPKYRLIGYVHLCSNPLLQFQSGSLVASASSLSGYCQPIRPSKKYGAPIQFTYNIERFGLQKHNKSFNGTTTP